jgi:hypothetical protein
MMIPLFWDIKQYCLANYYRCCGRTLYLLIQGRRVS